MEFQSQKGLKLPSYMIDEMVALGIMDELGIVPEDLPRPNMLNYRDNQIFIAVSEEMCPGWFWPIETTYYEHGLDGAKLDAPIPMSNLFTLKRPPWVS